MLVWFYHSGWMLLLFIGWITGDESWFQWAGIYCGVGIGTLLVMLCVAGICFALAAMIDAWEACFGRSRS